MLQEKQPYRYEAADLPLRRTVLNDAHRALGAKMVPFAGWEMPVQYPSGILSEHRAVRTAAGLFDVSHMGALEVSGRHALPFLEALLANCVSQLAPGKAQYSCILSPDGVAIDDIYVYRVERDQFMLVANAANAEHVKDWIQAVNERRVIVDRDMPAKELDGPVKFRDLRDAGEDSLAGLALQGPASLRVLQQLSDSASDSAALARLIANTHVQVRIAGITARVARSGYSGEKVGYEVYVHPDHVPVLWAAILDVGGGHGVLPAGLGARDSTRIEAGLPLFGQELEGDLGISMTEAGYGWVPRLHVPFFVGRGPYVERARQSRRRLVRLQGQGRKTVRPGHVVLDEAGKMVGQVTSFAYVHEDMTFIALACVDGAFRPEPGQTVRGARMPAERFAGAAEERSIVQLTALSRFPDGDERAGWAARYA